MPARSWHSLPRAEGTEKSPCSDSQQPSSGFHLKLLMACLLGPGPILPLRLNIKEGEESCTSGALQDINHSNSWPSGKLKPDPVGPLRARLPIHSLHLFWLQLLSTSYSHDTSRKSY